MITSKELSGWQALQQNVAQVLAECGFEVEVEASVSTVRGDVQIDVVGLEAVAGRRYTIFCECKHWKKNVPKNVIHGFRTVIADAGANVGYIISSSGFQSGSFDASELTNVRLTTWTEFQDEFEETWIEKYLRPTIRDRLDPIFTFIEPLLPRYFQYLSNEEQDHFMELRDEYETFGWTMMSFSPYIALMTRVEVPSLPIRPRLSADAAKRVPDTILDAISYREFLEASIAHGEQAISRFRKALAPGRARFEEESG